MICCYEVQLLNMNFYVWPLSWMEIQEAHLVRVTFFARCDWPHHMSAVLVGPRDGVERVEPYYGTPCLYAVS